MKPMLKYRGGKSRELEQIIPFVPNSYETYFEPFLGGGSLFFHLEPQNAQIGDLNEPLMTFYAGIRNSFDRVRAELDELDRTYRENRADFEMRKAAADQARVPDKNEDLYYQMRAFFNHPETSPYHPATVYYFINKTSYSGMVRYNKAGEYNVPYGRYRRFNTDLVTKEHSDLLAKAKLTCASYEKLFARATEADFMFLDPPYDCIFSDYGNPEISDGFGEDRHRDLATAFFSLPCKALLVIGKTPLTEELYERGIVAEYQKTYAVNIRNRFKSSSMHILVKNKDW